MSNKNNDFEQRLKSDKASIRERFSRVPVMDWFKRGEKQKELPPQSDDTRLEKGDVLAMILAVLSLVVPWLLAIAVGMAALIALLQFLFR